MANYYYVITRQLNEERFVRLLKSEPEDRVRLMQQGPRNRFLEEAQNSLRVIGGGRTVARINSAKVSFRFFAKQVHGRAACVQGHVIGRLETARSS